MSTSIYDLFSAMSQNEGYGLPGAIPTLNNNPLDITSGGTVVSFPSSLAGARAGLAKLQYDLSGQSSVYSPNQTLSDFMNTWTGGNPNAANNVASILGVPTSTLMSTIAGSGSSPASGGIGGDPFLNQLWMQGIAQHKSAGNVGSNVVEDGVAILVGLVLIAGAIFGFRNMGSVTVNTIRKGVAIAAT